MSDDSGCCRVRYGPFLAYDHHSRIYLGAFGGLTPRGFLQVSLFSERTVIPRQVVNKLRPDGRLGEEVSRQKRSEDFFREVEVCAMMNLDTARSLHKWLGEQITAMTEKTHAQDDESSNDTEDNAS